MPLDPLTSAIVSTVIGSAVQGILTPAPMEPATGIFRMLPVESRQGVMAPPWQGQVQIDGQTYLLAPAVVFRNDLNMIIPPMMVQSPVKVRFTIDQAGTVDRVWILSGAEVHFQYYR
ncbi:MAG: hypothetical protein Q8L56_00815 [Rhodocyclaceae bacterium]|nr:hypothetical protein [Rhodocyclaceae bacterium]